MGESRPSPASRVLRGARLGRYIVRERLGGGAMGVVHLADDLALQRPVALKLLNATLGDDTHELLRQEAHALARLSDPHVVQIFDVGIAFDLPYIAMELVVGVDLRRCWASIDDPRQRLALVLEAGLGLAAAHRAGVVHGDFKPDNVLCGSAGQVKVADFGLARLAAPAHAEAFAMVSSVGGTPSYMAPELHAGSLPDERSDQFAFCVTAYEAIAGTPPFRGDNLEALAAAKQLPAPLPVAAGVPRHVIAAILRGLALRPQARWPTMDRLLAEMAQRKRMHWWWWPAAAAIGAGLVTIVGPSPSRCEPAALERNQGCCI